MPRKRAADLSEDTTSILAIRIARRCVAIIEPLLRQEEIGDALREYYDAIREELEAVRSQTRQ